MKYTPANARWVCTSVALIFVLCLPAVAQVAKVPAGALDDLSFAKAELQPSTGHGLPREAQDAPSAVSAEACRAFLASEGSSWRAVYDPATGALALLEGGRIPWLPGSANRLSPLGDPLSRLPLLEGQARAFLARYPGLTAADPDELSLAPEASGRFSDYLDFAEFRWTFRGVPVEGARVVFRLNHGNLVQVGQEYVSPAIRSLDPEPSISLETAWEILWAYVGGRSPGDEVVDQGRLLVLPVAPPPAPEGRTIEPGKGLAYRLVFRLAFTRPGVVGTWEATVDAHTGEVLAFRDSNRYGRVKGGAYVTDQPTTELTRPFPFADVGGGYADGKGAFSGNEGTSTLNGKYVQIKDVCGATSASAQGGEVDFGKSGATDCATPGFGGDGNTRAARTQYYNVNLARARAATFLPNNPWLGGKLTDNVNIKQTCNAFWDGRNLNFYASGGGCGNTGELPGVSLHEWGHGFDDNDGNGSSDGGTGEAYGDISALLQLHRSCMGYGFLGIHKCTGYGNRCLDCTGVRDLDYERHASPTPAESSQLESGYSFRCSKSTSYAGPCGYEGHCESAIVSQAVWDLAARDLPAAGLDAATAWQLLDGYWYLSRPTAGSAYGCVKSTQVTDGCGVGNLYTVFRVVDDCDGDLGNGTPHGEALFAAFNRHGIACPSASHSDQACCGSLGAATLAARAEGSAALLEWSPVSGASTYALYRNENGCDAGYLRIASLPASATTYRDEDLPGGLTYHYRVRAVGATSACAGPMSECASVSAGLYVEASARPYPGGAPLNVTFQANAAGGQEPYAYAWDFGDGGSAAGETVSHTYSTVGSFNAAVTVTDAASRTAGASLPIAVVPPPVITSAQWRGSASKLVISGDNFHSSCAVKINGISVWTVWKSPTQVQAKNCGYYLKKGVQVSLTVTNLDDNLVSAPFYFTR